MEEKAMTELDRIIELLKRLPPDKQRLACEIIESWGKDAGMDTAAGYALPADNIERWVTRMTMERKSPRTIEMYRYYASKFLESYPKPARLEAQKYLADQLEGGTSPTAAKGMQKSITSLFKFLSEERLWPEDITAGLKGIKVARTEKYVPPLADVERVLAEGGWARKKDADKMRLLIVLLMETGLRISEAATIEKEKIDLEARTAEVLGKGSKVRKVPLSEPIVAYLTQYIEEHLSESPYLFPGEGAEKKHWQIHNAEKTLKRACARAGVVPFTPHALRHLFATTALKNGAKLEVVSRILGHASVGITGDVYRHTDMAEMREEVDRHGPMSDSRRLEK
jgi:site-specific recombinase XerD